MGMRQAVIFVLAAIFPFEAAAYIGPGAGLTAVGTVLGLIGLVFLAIVGFVWYPAKRLLGKRKHEKKAEETPPPPS